MVKTIYTCWKYNNYAYTNSILSNNTDFHSVTILQKIPEK